MLVSEKIKEAIKKEIKSQENLLKILELQEKNYDKDYGQDKQDIKNSIAYYNRILNEK